MNIEEIISGERRGLGAALARLALAGGAALYGVGVGVRNFYYGRWAFPVWLPVPVISVGNITVGGTGKTPMTVWLCERLLERGRRPAVLSRGYRAHEGIADELLLVSRRVPQAVAVANPDRVAAGQLAVQEYGVQAAVLDDGFQHRRMRRDLDIVLIDATRPFGFGRLLPRGLLREPLGSLRRAEAIVITRADQCEPGELAELQERLQRIHPDVPIVHAEHRPAGLWTLAGERSDPPSGAIGAFAGIARPDAFVHTLTSLGYPPDGVQWFPDHHAYSSDELHQLAQWAQSEGYAALITTEKDAVKLDAARFDWPLPVLVLRIDMAMRGDGDKILTGLIDAMLAEHADDSPEPRKPETPDARHAQP